MGSVSCEVDGVEEVDMLAVCVCTATATGSVQNIDKLGMVHLINLKF